MSKNNNVTGWKFEGKKGEFVLANPHKTSGLYFPLANEFGMMSSINPLLGGDIKTGQNTFLMAPVSIEDLHNSSSTRNFWIKIDDSIVWSAAGNSLQQKQSAYKESIEEEVSVTAGFLWQKVSRHNIKLGISSEITNFVPVNKDTTELMKVTIINTGKEVRKITPTAAIPIYGRSADNLRDHRHVTSLLNRISVNEYGIIVKPTLSFDERGHKLNNIYYSVQGIQQEDTKPLGFLPVEEDFIGEGGFLDWPEAIVKNSTEYNKKCDNMNGFEAIGAIRFQDTILNPMESISYVIILSISETAEKIGDYICSYGSVSKFDYELEKNKKWWNEKLSMLSFNSSDKKNDLWMKWVELQPVMRRIYGNSFLPYHDYGRGGRGWRDLWQDCLALLLLETKQVRKLLVNNYGGIRFDGSNATIIGNKPGEFIADRNNISRTWMDHGAWPYYTTQLYLNLSGDLNFLLENQVYFKDRQCCRSRKTDADWTDEYSSNQRDKEGRVYLGTILEHILIEQVTAFYNVGEHNNIKLEGADWNDGFDMAEEKGESVAFTAFYGSNLMDLSRLVMSLKEKLGIDKVEIAKEILLLLDSLSEKIDYNSVIEKNKLLNRYFQLCIHNISGEKVRIKVEDLSKDLENKGLWIINHIRENEWIKNSQGYEWFNGYYDNTGKAVEGEFKSGNRMTLTGQVFAVMGNVADDNQVKHIISSTNRYLRDDKVGGIRLNTDFKEVKLDMGRCFGFAYGHKENGAMFSHMTVMYINALYKRGYVNEGYEILNTIYRHSCDFQKSRIYPGIPEYFNERGRGMYPYLTGAASWLLLTVRIEIYGIKGLLGDLMVEPKLVKEQFDQDNKASIFTTFGDKQFLIEYRNEKQLEYGEYKIGKTTLNGEKIKSGLSSSNLVINKEEIDKLPENSVQELVIELIPQ